MNLSTIYYGLFTYVDSCASSMASGSETARSIAIAGSTTAIASIQSMPAKDRCRQAGGEGEDEGGNRDRIGTIQA